MNSLYTHYDQALHSIIFLLIGSMLALGKYLVQADPFVYPSWAYTSHINHTLVQVHLVSIYINNYNNAA